MQHEEIFWFLIFVGLAYLLGWVMGSQATLYRVRIQAEEEADVEVKNH
jgi:hypothetical protein